MAIALLIIITLTLLLVGAGYYFGGKMAASPRGAVPHYDKRDSFKTPEDLGLQAELVTFPAHDGLALKGWYIEAEDKNAPALVCMHGGRDDKRYFLPLAPALHAAGFALLLIDGRCHGESADDPKGLSLGVRDHMDVMGGADFLTAQGHTKLGALGCSQGSACVVIAAARDPRLKTLILESTGYKIGRAASMMFPKGTGFLVHIMTMGLMLRLGYPFMDALKAEGSQYRLANRLADRDVLILQGDNDEITPLEDVAAYAARFGRATPVEVLPGGKHCILRRDPEWYKARALPFLKEHLLK